MDNKYFAFAIIESLKIKGGNFLDSNNILWKIIDNKIIGKRSVFTKSMRASWIDDLRNEEIQTYWCGIDSDYKETFQFNY